MCAELELDADAVLGERFIALRALGDAPGRGDADLAWQAQVLAQGELMSSTLGVAYLRRSGLDVHWRDARDWLQARSQPNQSAWSRRLLVNCEIGDDRTASARLAAMGSLHLTQGFIARAEDGGTAILGRGGSDTSATHFLP